MRAQWSLPTVVVLAAAVAASAGAEMPRELRLVQPALGLERVSVDVAVGDVTVTVSPDTAVHATVLLTPRRGGIFSSRSEGERQVREAELDADLDGGTLELSVQTSGKDHRFEARWQLQLPKRLALEVNVGVGDVTIVGLEGGCELDTGVGDLSLAVEGGDIDAEVGVGDVSVTAPGGAYGEVDGSTGVGDARLKVGKRRIRGEGMVSKELKWSGEGPGTIEIETGVGDIKITLQ